MKWIAYTQYLWFQVQDIVAKCHENNLKFVTFQRHYFQDHQNIIHTGSARWFDLAINRTLVC